MKLALVTTTIGVPHVLKLYRTYTPSCTFYVMGDRKTPDKYVEALLADMPDVTYYSYDCQASLGYKCHEVIGENSIQRRNIGFLEALKHGADVVYSCDDDNIPIDEFHFQHIREALSHPFNGIGATCDSDFFDVGRLLNPLAPHRGIPHDNCAEIKYYPAFNVKVGVAAGVCIGDPDISAYYRMANRPQVHQVSELLRAGLISNPAYPTLFNSQNTAVIRELIPAWCMWSGVGRMDDIYASLVVQRIMRDREMAVHFGLPFVWQTRNEHDLVKDLRGEIDGYEHINALADLIFRIYLPHESIIGDLREIWTQIQRLNYIPHITCDVARLYLDDCEACL